MKSKAAVKPSEILLVIDAMTGQEAANVAASFNERLDVTGIILSKLDSDTRGGAALFCKSDYRKTGQIRIRWGEDK